MTISINEAFLGLQWLTAAHPEMIMGSEEEFKVNPMLSLSAWSLPRFGLVTLSLCQESEQVWLCSPHRNLPLSSFFCSAAPSVLQSHM